MNVLEEELVKALVDRFTAAELCELLEISTEELIGMFEELVLENSEELWDELKYGR